MIKNSPIELEESIAESIRKAISKEIERIIMLEAEKAGDRVEQQVKGMVGSIASTVLSNFTFERFGSTLKITVDFQNTKST